MVRAGILRHRVQIQEWTDTGSDEWGQPVKDWVDVVSSLPAEVRDIRGREFWEVGQAQGGEVTTRVRIRYREDLDRTMRVFHAGRELMIEAIIDPDGRREELHLMCREGT
jgi:SPP1 family predicted phage head-tail adaptor